MRDLDDINSAAVRPRSFAAMGALLPLISAIVCIPLAIGTAPHLPFRNNILAVFSLALGIASLLMVAVPFIFTWDWRSKFFGLSLLYVGSVGLIGIVPWLGIVFYSALPVAARALTFLLYMCLLFGWGRRFVLYYRRIFHDPILRRKIYTEEEDAIYYLQGGDKQIADKEIILQQFPPAPVVIGCIALSLSLLPFASHVSALVGVQFFHIFLTIMMIPLVLMCFGLAIRGFLVFYFYPWQLRRTTGKEVYVIMAIADNRSPTRQ